MLTRPISSSPAKVEGKDAPRTAGRHLREAGVSRQTVSRVINIKGELSHETLENIRAVIARLGYCSSGLATQDTLTIGLVVPDIANPPFADISTRTRRSLARPSYEGGHQAAAQLLIACPAIDALLCYHDLVEVGALLACYELGCRVPRDAAVIGADDIPMYR
jgi:DNA-binding LacI/PurR family transcriptional regulator